VVVKRKVKTKVEHIEKGQWEMVKIPEAHGAG
jgi:hypothetical protein